MAYKQTASIEPMANFAFAVMMAIFLSCLIVCIEVAKAASAPLKTVLRGSTGIYLLLVIVGNITTTLLAASTTNPAPNTIPDWFWFAFLGVFGFEVILKNVNMTFYGNGFLTINDWITKARDIAVADVIEANVYQKEDNAQLLTQKLKLLPEQQLNAHIINILGTESLQSLEHEAAMGNADAQLVKALALAKYDYKAAKAIAPH